MDLMVLCNSGCNRFVVSFQKNYIFYKNHQTASDKTRKLFMSALDKYTDYDVIILNFLFTNNFT